MGKANGEIKQPRISCRVSLGLFSNERSITIELPNGEEFSTIVDKSHVMVKREPSPDVIVDGYVKVVIVECKKNSVVLDLPRPAFTHGTRIQVPIAFLQR